MWIFFVKFLFMRYFIENEDNIWVLNFVIYILEYVLYIFNFSF